MLDILKVLGWLYIFAYITDMIVIAIIAYFFTHAILVSVLIGVLGQIFCFGKNRLLDKIFMG